MEEISTEVEVEVLSNEERAQKIIRRNMHWSMGIGLMPFPVLDIAGLITVQIKLIKELSEVYERPFKNDIGKSVVTSLIGALSGTTLAAIGGSVLIKAVPIFGTLIGVTSFSIASGAITYAIGKVFVSHYEAGGTLLDFKPETMKEYFRQQYEVGNEQARADKEATPAPEPETKAKAKTAAKTA